MYQWFNSLVRTIVGSTNGTKKGRKTFNPKTDISFVYSIMIWHFAVSSASAAYCWASLEPPRQERRYKKLTEVRETTLLIFPSPRAFISHLLRSIKFTTPLLGRYFCMKSFITTRCHSPRTRFFWEFFCYCISVYGI